MVVRFLLDGGVKNGVAAGRGLSHQFIFDGLTSKIPTDWANPRLHLLMSSSCLLIIASYSKTWSYAIEPNFLCSLEVVLPQHIETIGKLTFRSLELTPGYSQNYFNFHTGFDLMRRAFGLLETFSTAGQSKDLELGWDLIASTSHTNVSFRAQYLLKGRRRA